MEYNMDIVKTTPKGQIMIPSRLRKKYGIKGGTRVLVSEKDGEIRIKPLFSDPVAEAKGMFKEGQSALRSLLSDRAEEAEQ